MFNPPACAEFPTALTPSSLLCSDLSAPHHPKWVSCREERRNLVRKKRGRFTARGSIPKRQLSSFRKQAFFLSFHWGGAFISLCITTETIHNREFYPSWFSFLPLHSTKTHIHALFLSNCWSLLQLHACLPVCLFLEAHNMADMCFVIVGTSSSLLAYKGLVISQATATTPTETTNQPFFFFFGKKKIILP